MSEHAVTQEHGDFVVKLVKLLQGNRLPKGRLLKATQYLADRDAERDEITRIDARNATIEEIRTGYLYPAHCDLCRAVAERERAARWRASEDAAKLCDMSAGEDSKHAARRIRSLAALRNLLLLLDGPQLTARDVQNATEAPCVHNPPNFGSCYVCMANWLNVVLDSQSQPARHSEKEVK